MTQQTLLDMADDDGGGLPPGWTLRPDWRGVLAPERKDLKSSERWWARGPFESLPEPAHQDCAGRDGAGRLDPEDLSHERPSGGPL